MSSDEPVLLDTRDMLGVHRALDNGLLTASEAIAALSDGDRERAERVSAFVSEVLWLLHAHHDGEDELLYPLLIERAAEEGGLFSKMDEQHVSVSRSADSTQQANGSFAASALSAESTALVASLDELRKVVGEHATAEETDVLPIAARVITAPEWGALPAHALSSYRGERMWLPLGLVFEAMPDDIRSSMLEHMPPPVVSMWNGGGADAFAAEMQFIGHR